MKVTCSSCSFERERPLEQPTNAASVPSRGDFWLCPRCGALHRFTGSFMVDNRTYAIGELYVRAAAEEELEELEEPFRSMLRRQRDEIRAGAPS